MTQSTFPFAALPPHVRGSATSAAAAESIRDHVGRMQQVVLDFIRSHPEGVTDEQGILSGVCSVNGWRARRQELVRIGLVRDSGETRLTKAGREATIWRAT